jgi:hypothetical protein
VGREGEKLMYPGLVPMKLICSGPMQRKVALQLVDAQPAVGGKGMSGCRPKCATCTPADARLSRWLLAASQRRAKVASDAVFRERQSQTQVAVSASS